MILPPEGAFNQTKNLFQRGVELGRVLPPGLGHFGPAASGSTHLGRHGFNEFAGFEPADQVLRHHDQQRNLALTGRRAVYSSLYRPARTPMRTAGQ